MSHRHFIRLLDDSRAQWLALDRAGHLISGPREGFPDTVAEETIVLVPSHDVLWLQAPRISRQARQLEQGIAYAIEDQLAAPIEQLHVAVHDTGDAEHVETLIVSRARLEHWLTRLREHGIQPDYLLPEGVLIPWGTTPALLLDGQTACLRHAQASLLSGTLDEVAIWWAVLPPESRAAPIPVFLPHAQAAPSWPDITLQPETVDVFPWLATRWTGWQDKKMNLLSRDYAPQRRQHGDRRLWRWAAIVAACGLGLTFSSMVLEWWQLNRHYQEKRTQMEAVLQEALPGQRIVDPRAQIMGELSRRTGQNSGGNGLVMLARVAPLLSGSGRYTLEGLEYRNGLLDITANAGDIATLDELRERIATLGYGVELASMTPGSHGVEGKLRVQGAP